MEKLKINRCTNFKIEKQELYKWYVTKIIKINKTKPHIVYGFMNIYTDLNEWHL
jgi:hypothetical protein